MRVIRARVLGMCPGVRRALDIAQAEPCPRDVTLLGELVHNRGVTERLLRQGFCLRDGSGGTWIPPTPRALIPAHGIAPGEACRLGSLGMGITDATCPFVKSIHAAAKTMASEGRFVVIIGKPGHAEVEGIRGCAQRHAVVPHPEEAAHYDAARLGVVCQSTISLSAAMRAAREIRRLNPQAEMRCEWTICPATRERQAAVRELVRRVDAIVVIGGSNSNNTLELVDLVRKRGVPCIHVESAQDLKRDPFHGMRTVGVTAGASTPDEDIDSVCHCLAGLGLPSGRVRPGWPSAYAPSGPAGA